MLDKGTRFFKVDPHFSSHKFCTSQSWYKDGQKRGCFPLSHDSPSESNPYHSLNDILQFLNSRSTRFQQEKAYISLCFKDAPKDICNALPTATSWLSLVDDFFNEANQLVSTLGLNVEFIFDGAATPTAGNECLKDRWRPWNCTYISDESPSQAFRSNDRDKGYDRFQVLDDSENILTWISSSQQNWGKFSNTSYPLMLWEPSDQKVIQQYAEFFRNNQTPNHDPGFVFNINIDPAMFVVYASPFLQDGLNLRNDQFLSAKFPQVAVINFGSMSGNVADKYLITTYQRDSQWFISTSRFISPLRSLQHISTQPLNITVPDTVNAQYKLSSASVEKSTFISICTSTGVCSILKVIEPGCFEKYLTVELTEAISITSILSATAFTCGARVPCVSALTLDTESIQDSSCQAYLQMFVVPATQDWHKPLKTVMRKVCIQTSVPITAGDVATVELLEDVIIDSGVCNKGDYLSFVSLNTEDDSIHTGIVCTSPSMTSIRSVVGHIKNESILIPVQSDVGRNSKVSVVLQGGVPILMEVHDTGYCHNSHSHNTRAAPTVCAAAPKATENVLVYNVGSLDRWIADLKDGTMLLSSCGRVQHGAYDQGTLPSVALFSADDSIQFIEAHQGLHGASTDKGGCGLPLPFDGIVMDSWTLQDQVTSEPSRSSQKLRRPRTGLRFK
eukprot:GILJ01008744.1.p1 GENE.GILJ01008744.1~~GILJ01008744.1.p1  ORF type:complete len:725 (-),score=82.49 GILJ01008744.1:339-2360(-)